ncbi:hypothetical protein ACOME3_005824 [Neoechinorhynchus agilis]
MCLFFNSAATILVVNLLVYLPPHLTNSLSLQQRMIPSRNHQPNNTSLGNSPCYHRHHRRAENHQQSRHYNNRKQLVRMHRLVSRSQCTLHMTTNGTVFGLKNMMKRSESVQAMESFGLISSVDDHLTFIPVAPALVFIQSSKSKLWLCANGTRLVGRINRDNRNCLFRQQRAMYSRVHLHWDHFQLYKSNSYLRIAWFPQMGDFCSVRLVSVDDWNQIRHPDFFTLLMADISTPDARKVNRRRKKIIPQSENSRYKLSDGFKSTRQSSRRRRLGTNRLYKSVLV